MTLGNIYGEILVKIVSQDEILNKTNQIVPVVNLTVENINNCLFKT